MEVTLIPVLDDGETGPQVNRLEMPQHVLPNTGDTMLIAGTAWTCVHRAWHTDVPCGKLELYIERNPDYTAMARRKQFRVVDDGSQPAALPE